VTAVGMMAKWATVEGGMERGSLDNVNKCLAPGSQLPSRDLVLLRMLLRLRVLCAHVCTCVCVCVEFELFSLCHKKSSNTYVLIIYIYECL